MRSTFFDSARDGSDGELGLLYYLFSAHHWGLRDLRALWEGETGWHDLVYALASHEANERAKQMKGMRGKAKVKVAKSVKAKK